MIKLKSDVSNDLIQNADQIGSVAKAISEFVWNSVQYRHPDRRPRVEIEIRRSRPRGAVKEIAIRDNGRGMSKVDLARFFTMHAENLDRAQGRAGRGRFGTGAKAAAMAVANEMVVSAVRGKHRHISTLKREALRSGVSEVPIPTTSHPAEGDSGTEIRLRRLRVKRFREQNARTYVARSLGRALFSADVLWDGKPLSYVEPEFEEHWQIRPPATLAALIGRPVLDVRLAKSWLEEDDLGITISAMGVPQERGFLGKNESSPLAGRLYGLIEVPLLEQDDEEGRPAYTADRSMQLNRENLRVQALLKWLDAAVREVLEKLEEAEKAKQDEIRRQRLVQTARTIEDALNRRLCSAMQSMERKLNIRARATERDGLDVESGPLEEDGASNGGEGIQHVRRPQGDIPYRPAEEGETPDLVVLEHHRTGPPKPEPDKPPSGKKPVDAVSDPTGERRATTRGASEGSQPQRRPKGSFSVIPKDMGEEGPRAHYATTQMAIYVNTQHPQLAAAGSPETTEFKVLMAECAANEFALAVTAMRIENGDPEIDSAQWHSVIVAARREMSATGAELAHAIAGYRNRDGAPI